MSNSIEIFEAEFKFNHHKANGGYVSDCLLEEIYGNDFEKKFNDFLSSIKLIGQYSRDNGKHFFAQHESYFTRINSVEEKLKEDKKIWGKAYYEIINYPPFKRRIDPSKIIEVR